MSCAQDDSGMTVEGLQEWYDEACLMVYNNKYQDGVQWHDVPCYFRWVPVTVELSTNLRVQVPDNLRGLGPADGAGADPARRGCHRPPAGQAGGTAQAVTHTRIG